MLLSVQNLTKEYVARLSLLNWKPQITRALNNVSFDLESSQSLGIVGESGCGKSTLAKILSGMILPSIGGFVFGDMIQKATKDVQLITQNPFEAVNPLMTVEEILLEPLFLNRMKDGAKGKIDQMLAAVSLSPDSKDKLPYQLSGGQLQRIIIARALLSEPKLLICDEPTSSLDLCVQAQILDLLINLKKTRELTLIFISHNLKVVRLISDRIIVMQSGIIVEQGLTQNICESPKHSYTKELMGEFKPS